MTTTRPAPRLTSRARRDLEDIRRHTRDRWGEGQWLRYFRGLAEAFDRIAADPMTGQRRDSLRPGMRSVTFGRHLIFFAPIAAANGAPVILRILHQRRALAVLVYAEDD